VGYLLPVLDADTHQGVCLYDPSRKDFMVVSLSGAEAQQHASPIKPAACFTIYDEARCRGTDLKLAPTTKALLTLGPGCAKDKLMQAAGRLRQLGPGQQTLVLAGPPEVTGKIWEAASGGSNGRKEQQMPCGEPSMAQVLNWVMANTVQNNLQGVASWVAAGLHYHATYGQPQRSQLPELLELEHFYASSKAAVPAHQVLEAMLQKALGGIDVGAAAEAQLSVQRMREVTATGSCLAAGHEIVAGMGADEECERELQREQEQEEEEEVQVAKAAPAAEVDWQYSAALQAGSVTQLQQVAGIMPLAQLVQQLHPAGLGDIPWSSDVFVTRNFYATVTGTSGLSEYLRPLGHLLLFSSGEVLLLSDREADGVLKAAWGGSISAVSKPPQLMLLTHADPHASQLHAGSGLRQAAAAATGQPLTVTLGTGKHVSLQLTVQQVVSLLLFNGGAMYSSKEQRQQLVRMVRGRQEEVEALLALRGKLPQLPRSHLERASNPRLVAL
jgi:hypothetical protein